MLRAAPEAHLTEPSFSVEAVFYQFPSYRIVAFSLISKKDFIKDEMGEACSAHGRMRSAYRYKIMVGKPEGKISLGRPRRRWEDTIKMDLREIGFWSVDWIHLAQGRDFWRALVNTVMKHFGFHKRRGIS
jgi:hypothetical protein